LGTFVLEIVHFERPCSAAFIRALFSQTERFYVCKCKQANQMYTSINFKELILMNEAFKISFLIGLQLSENNSILQNFFNLITSGSNFLISPSSFVSECYHIVVFIYNLQRLLSSQRANLTLKYYFCLQHYYFHDRNRTSFG